MLQKKTVHKLSSLCDLRKTSSFQIVFGCRKYCWTWQRLFWIKKVKRYQSNNILTIKTSIMFMKTLLYPQTVWYSISISSHAQDLHSAASCMTTHCIFLLQGSWGVLVSIMHGIKHYTTHEQMNQQTHTNSSSWRCFSKWPNILFFPYSFSAR